MDIPLDEQIHFDAITTTPSTGAAVDGDSAPTFAVYEEATDTDIGVGGSMTKRTSLTGNYRGTFTISAANGFEVGKWYNVIGTGVVGGVTGKAVLKTFRVVLAESVVGEPKVDVGAWLGTAAATPTVAGVPEVDVTHWLGTAPATPSVAGVPEVDLTHINGAAVTTAVDPLVIATGTIGSTGNDATHLHLDGLTFGDDELNDLLLVVYDNSGTEYHSRWVSDWVLSTELATLASALPFTPENAVDTYVVLSLRRDVTGGGSAPTASEIADEVQTRTIAGVTLVATTTNLTNLPSIPANWITAAGIATGAIDADAVAADAVTEIQSGLATAAELAKVPKSDGAVTWNATALDSINAEVDTALTDYDALVPADLPANFGALVITVGGALSNVTTVATVTNPVTAGTVSDKTGYALTSGERDSIAAALLDLANGIESGKTLRQAMRLMAAALAGKRSNSGTATEQYDAIGSPGTARIVGNADAAGDGTPTLTP